MQDNHTKYIDGNQDNETLKDVTKVGNNVRGEKRK